MKSILIIDNDSATLGRLSEELEPYNAFQILTAGRAEQAAKLLELIPISLVLTELDMPDVDGFKLLAYIRKKYPGIPGMVMTKHLTPPRLARLRALGISRHFEKPVDMEVLTESIFEELDIVAAGRIHGISLATFLQLVDIEQKTCTLTVKSAGRNGRVRCAEGEIIGAETGKLEGKEALYRIMFWDKAMIQIDEHCDRTERNIDSPLMYLLMESHQIRDEMEAAAEENETLSESSSPGTGLSKSGDNASVQADSPPRKEPGDHTINFGTSPATQNTYGVSENRPEWSDWANTTVEDLFGIRRSAGSDAGNEERSAASVTDAGTLSEVLKNAPDIYEYGIFDQNDNLKNRDAVSDPLRSLSPSFYFAVGNALSSDFGGDLGYVDIHTPGQGQYAIIRYHRYFIAAALKPGVRTADFIRETRLRVQRRQAG